MSNHTLQKMTWEEIISCPMTSEEAIKQLKDFIILHREQHGWDVSTIKALEMGVDALEFAKWVAEEIFSDDWEFNKESFEEIACRKLKKMGIVRKTETDWELAESEDKE